MINLRCYGLAVEVYREVTRLDLKGELRDQLKRASSSVVLNLAEGRGKRTKADRERFFTMAFGSIREMQAIADLEPEKLAGVAMRIDRLAASVYRLKD